MLTFLLFRSSLASCVIDTDCNKRLRGDVHSSYCIEGVCKKLVQPGYNCVHASDCASFFYYGPIACTETCSRELVCSFDNRTRSEYCCRAIPENGNCMPPTLRPPLLNGCGPRQKCLPNANNEYVCSMPGKYLWVLGVVFIVLANGLISLGLNVQKRSFRNRVLLLGNYKFDAWWAGLTIYTIGKILGFCSYLFGSQSLLAPLGSSGLVFNSVFAPMINFESFTVYDFFVIVFCIVGSTLVVLYSNRGVHLYSLCELLILYTSTRAIVWFVFLILLVAALYMLARFIEANTFEDRRTLFTRSVRYVPEDVIVKYGLPFVYSLLAALFGSFTTLFSKSCAEMIDKTTLGDNQFVYSITYVFFVVVVFCIALQIYWINRALKRYPALVIVPIFHMTWTVFTVTTAGIYFNDFSSMNAKSFAFFSVGIVFIAMGCVCVMIKKTTNSKNIKIKEKRQEKHR